VERSDPIRWLVASGVLCLLGFALAAGTLVYVNNQDAENRDIVVRFVCAAVATARETPSAEAQLRAARFESILYDIGEKCEP
jgi:hypothetical protein